MALQGRKPQRSAQLAESDAVSEPWKKTYSTSDAGPWQKTYSATEAGWQKAIQGIAPAFGLPGQAVALAARRFPREAAGIAQQIAQGVTFGGADEAVSAVSAIPAAVRGGAPAARQQFTQAQREQRASREDFARRNPALNAWAQGSGMALSAAVPVGAAGRFVAAAPTLGGAALRSGLAGAATGAGQGFLSADEGERMAGAVGGAVAGGALGAAAPYLTSAAGGLAQRLTQPGLKPIDPSVRLLAEEGVALTPGQMRGGVARSAEEAATSLPMLGTAISERRMEGIETFNRAVANRVLKPVGEKLPENIRPGSEAVKYAGDLISKGYEDTIPGRSVRLDPAFSEDVALAFDAITDMTPAGRDRLDDIIFQRVTSRLPENGVIDGRRYKLIQSDLDKSVDRFSKSMDSDDQAMAETLRGIQSALEGAAKRQDPDFADKMQALDRSWAELSRMEVAAGKDNQLGGIFTPAQYGQAIRAADSRVRKRGAARGEALSQDLAQAALQVLPSRTPDSGTAGRAGWGMAASYIPSAIAGAMTGGPILGPAAGIAGQTAALGAASRLYTPEAIEAANAALRQRMVQQSELMERLGGELPAYRPVLPGLNAPNPFSFLAAPPRASTGARR